MSQAQDYILDPLRMHEEGITQVQSDTFSELRFHEKTGTILLTGTKPAWKSFTPLSDNRPSLAHQQIHLAQLRGGVLGILSSLSTSMPRLLQLFRGPDGVRLGEYSQPSNSKLFAISHDGRYLARQESNLKVAVHDLGSGGTPILSTYHAMPRPPLIVTLGHNQLIVSAANWEWLIRWDQPQLVTAYGEAGSITPWPESVRSCFMALSPQGRNIPRPVAYDSTRFASIAQIRLTVATDHFGHLIILNSTGSVVCLFCILRDQLAGWMPDGTRFGPPSLLGCQATPGALQKFADALRVASLEKGPNP
jgi:hypothetical protein